MEWRAFTYSCILYLLQVFKSSVGKCGTGACMLLLLLGICEASIGMWKNSTELATVNNCSNISCVMLHTSLIFLIAYWELRCVAGSYVSTLGQFVLFLNDRQPVVLEGKILYSVHFKYTLFIRVFYILVFLIGTGKLYQNGAAFFSNINLSTRFTEFMTSLVLTYCAPNHTGFVTSHNSAPKSHPFLQQTRHLRRNNVISLNLMLNSEPCRF
jgi:hypothetical protein